ncbi:MAG: hypothetical protein RLZZ292_2436 [Bacteroidota bacterium]|jgi:hypothetical protein
MTTLFKKLNFKDHTSIVVLNAPISFGVELEAMSGFSSILHSINEATTITFAIAFATKQTEIDVFISEINEKAVGDVIVWLCYPKGTSKKYQCEFNRDTGWATVGALGYEPVRAVAIDEDWSALRFRKVEFIKKITRHESFALTKEGKERTTQKEI